MAEEEDTLRSESLPAPFPLSEVKGASTSLNEDMMSAIRSSRISINVKVCATCGEKIEGEYTEAMGQRYHLDHFTCYCCHMLIANKEFIVQDGKPYCKDDYNHIFVDKCSGCGQVLNTSDVVVKCGKTFHISCITCSGCQTSLSPDEIKIVNDNIMCESCDIILKTNLTTSRTASITSIGNETSEDGMCSDDESDSSPRNTRKRGVRIGSMDSEDFKVKLDKPKTQSVPSLTPMSPDIGFKDKVEEHPDLPEETNSELRPFGTKKKLSNNKQNAKAAQLLGMKETTSNKAARMLGIGAVEDSFHGKVINEKESSPELHVAARRGSSDKGKVEVVVAPRNVSTWERKKMLESYLPDLVLQTIDDRVSLQNNAFCEKAHCAVVLADISGFTPLTERYCMEKDGPEKLSEVLNEYFDLMIDIIYMHGGDVIKFAGDALLVIWQDKSLASNKLYIDRTFEPAKAGSTDDHDSDEETKNEEKTTTEKNEGEITHNNTTKTSDATSETIELSNGEEEEIWLQHIVKADEKYLSSDDNGICNVCSNKVTKKITDYARFSSDVLQNCIVCGNVVCDACLSVEIRDGRHLWPKAAVDAIETCNVCTKCVAERSKNICFEKRLNVLSLRCIQACLELMLKVDGNKGLRLHMGVGSGEVLFLHVGGLKERWEFLVAGDALQQMGHAEPESKSGEICVSPQTWDRVKNRCEGVPVESGSGVYKVTKVVNQVPTMPSARRWSSWNIPAQMRPRSVGSVKESAIMRYIPGAIRTHLVKKNMTSAPQTAELRKVSVLFVNLPSLGYGASNQLSILQKALMVMQAALYQFEGSLRQFIMDDKGTTLIGVFGLYPFSHENDSLLATRCALEMQARLQDSDIACSIGVTTGSVYSGSVGSFKRSEYAVVGDIVNLSARLMVAGLKMSKNDIHKAFYGPDIPQPASNEPQLKLPQPVLCDNPTFNEASAGVKFRKLTPIMVKGKKDAIEIYFPLEEANADENLSIKFIGQKEPLNFLKNKIENMTASSSGHHFGHSRIQSLRNISVGKKDASPPESKENSKEMGSKMVLIDGVLGIGKSRILAEALSTASNVTRVMILQGCGDPMEESSSFFAFRPIFAKLLSAGKLNDNDNILVRGRKLTCVDIKTTPLGKALSEHDMQLIPLLRDALPDLEIEETTETKDLVGQARNEETIRFMIRILLSCSHATVIALENAQWFDPSSWKLIMRLTEACLSSEKKDCRILILLTMRSDSTPNAKKMSQDCLDKMKLFPETFFSILTLQPLDENDFKSLVCAKISENLKPTNLPKIVSDIVYGRSNGNPLYTLELVITLLEQNLIKVAGDNCVVDRRLNTNGEIPLPDSLAGIITSRIDRLEPRCQLLIKLASVVGELLIDKNILVALAAKNITTAEMVFIEEDLAKLAKRDLLAVIKPEPDLTYGFKHSMIKEVAYNMMLFSQRRKCHAIVAQHLETSNSHPEEDDKKKSTVTFAAIGERYSQLAYHYDKANMPTNAVEYFERAANIAEKSFDNENVIMYLQKAMSLGGELKREAKWERQIGNAYLKLGQLTKARHHFQIVLEFHKDVVSMVSSKVGPLRVEIELLLHGASSAKYKTYNQTSSMGGKLTMKSTTLKNIDMKDSGDKKKEEKLALYESVTSLISKSEIDIWLGDALEGTSTIIMAIKLALRLQEASVELAIGFGILCCLATSVLNNQPLSERCAAMALKIAEPLYNPAVIAKLQELVAYRDLGQCLWDSVNSKSTEASDIYKSLRDSRGKESSTILMADAALFKGDYLHSLKIYGEVLASATNRGDVQVQVWSWLGLCHVYWICGNFKNFIYGVDEIENLVTKNSDQVDVSSRLSVQLLICLVRLMKGQLKSELLFDSIRGAMDQEYPEYRLLYGLRIACEILMMAYEKSLIISNAETDEETVINSRRHHQFGYGLPVGYPLGEDYIQGYDPKDFRGIEKRLESIVNQYCKFALTYPLALPSSARIKAHLLWLQNKKPKAEREWKRGIAEGVKRDLPVDEARNHYDLGRFAEASRPRRSKHLSRALDFFQKHGCEVFASYTKIENDVTNKAQSEHAERIITSKISKEMRESKVKISLPDVKLFKAKNM